jgi:hypothetical protein
MALILLDHGIDRIKAADVFMVIRIFNIVLLIVLSCGTASANDCVVLLHGLGRTSYSMHTLEKELAKEGYLVVNDGYPSRKENINELTRFVGEGITQCKKRGAGNIHFVTHSLGGILVRNYFQTNVVSEAGRVVMLGPPNHGSEVVDKYKNKWWFRIFTGPAGQELGTGLNSIPNRLRPIPLGIGIIAGTESLDPWFSGVVHKPNDGKVSVSSTKLVEMKDFITVPHSHAFLCNSTAVIRQVKHFLSLGRFEHDK